MAREQCITQALPSPSRYSCSALEIPELFRTAAHLQICLGVVSMSCQGGVNIWLNVNMGLGSIFLQCVTCGRWMINCSGCSLGCWVLNSCFLLLLFRENTNNCHLKAGEWKDAACWLLTLRRGKEMNIALENMLLKFNIFWTFLSQQQKLPKRKHKKTARHSRTELTKDCLWFLQSCQYFSCSSTPC